MIHVTWKAQWYTAVVGIVIISHTFFLYLFKNVEQRCVNEKILKANDMQM